MITFQNYIRPADLETAWTLNQKKSAVLIGGMQWLKMESRRAQTAIDLSDLGLDQIEENDREFVIGCMVSLRQFETHPGLNELTNGAIREALRHIVGVQFRNTATVGGSVASRFGFSDVTTMLLALDAEVELYKAGRMPIGAFDTYKRDRDILVRVIVPKKQRTCCYQSVRNTETDFPVLTCAAVKTAEGWQFAIGARPGIAMLFRDDGALSGERPGEAQITAFADKVKEAVPTGSNLRGSAAYRKHLAGVLVRRTIEQIEGGQSWN